MCGRVWILIEGENCFFQQWAIMSIQLEGGHYLMCGYDLRKYGSRITSTGRHLIYHGEMKEAVALIMSFSQSLYNYFSQQNDPTWVSCE